MKKFQISFDPSKINDPNDIRTKVLALGIDFVELRVLERPTVLALIVRSAGISPCELEEYINLIPGLTVKYMP